MALYKFHIIIIRAVQTCCDKLISLGYISSFPVLVVTLQLLPKKVVDEDHVS